MQIIPAIFNILICCAFLKILQTILFQKDSTNVRFDGLTAGTQYGITVTTDNGKTVFSTTATTKSPLARKSMPVGYYNFSFRQIDASSTSLY